MTHSHLPKKISGLVLSIALTAAAHPLAAQCVSGLGVSTAQLVSQNWGGNLPIDVTNITEVDSGNPFSTPVQFVAVAADPSGGTVGLSPIYNGTPNFQMNAYKLTWNVTANRMQYYGMQISKLPPTTSGLYSAGGVVWAATTDGRAYNTEHSFSSNGDPVALPVGVVQGATSDGRYVWFSTAAGRLQSVQLASSTAVGVLAGSVQLTKSSLGPLAFDGHFIWAASGGSLIAFDPASGAISTPYQLGGTISSLTFDGVYLWIANSDKAALLKFDPVTRRVVNDFTPGGPGFTSVIFNGRVISAYSPQSTTTTALRACDASTLASANLPAEPLQATFDGLYTWIIYSGTSTISLR